MQVNVTILTGVLSSRRKAGARSTWKKPRWLLSLAIRVTDEARGLRVQNSQTGNRDDTTIVVSSYHVRMLTARIYTNWQQWSFPQPSFQSDSCLPSPRSQNPMPLMRPKYGSTKTASRKRESRTSDGYLCVCFQFGTSTVSGIASATLANLNLWFSQTWSQVFKRAHYSSPINYLNWQ